jgi:hypothetical protein
MVLRQDKMTRAAKEFSNAVGGEDHPLARRRRPFRPTSGKPGKYFAQSG